MSEKGYSSLAIPREPGPVLAVRVREPPQEGTLWLTGLFLFKYCNHLKNLFLTCTSAGHYEHRDQQNEQEDRSGGSPGLGQPGPGAAAPVWAQEGWLVTFSVFDTPPKHNWGGPELRPRQHLPLGEGLVLPRTLEKGYRTPGEP